MKDAAESLIAGNLVVFPTETVYGLGADATNEKAVARIYEVKGRPTNHPLIVHISSINNLDKWARNIPEYAIKLARNFWPGPMTLILPRTELAKDFITGGQDNVGVRVPAHSIAQSLLNEFEVQGGIGVAAPSANRFGAVSPTTAIAVELELEIYLMPTDQILEGGHCDVGIESTIIDCTRKVPTVLRPGAVTIEKIQRVTEISCNLIDTNSSDKVRASGLLKSHYAPNAQVILNNYPNEGDGFIAMASIPTPYGSIRLASPTNLEEFAQILYSALRKADSMQINKVYVAPPVGNGLALAIIDRLTKASAKNVN
jgi:L-threonylcarbamoyladenylate synthase